MNARSDSQSFMKNLTQGGLGKGIIALGCMGVLVLFVVIVILGGYVYINGNAASQSEIYFRTPMDGERVNAGEPLDVRILAKDEHKISRLELWMDGQLIETQSSTLPGGSNPFPMLTNINPPAGSHTLIARAVNSQNASSQTSITIEARSLDDADDDGVSDTTDACPNEAGSAAANGCPDRDSDGIADTVDVCPDEAGLPEDGCPAPSEDDRDGDGTSDVADACPDEPGSPLADGCIDTDGDRLPDITDACPEEPGFGEDGCPIAGDADGDTVLDPDDACPHEWGLPESGGCPDVDGDGFIDSEDVCPAEPGTIDGCPDAGGSGVEPPEEGGDDDEGVPGDDSVFGDMGSDEAVDLVRLEALSFSVTQDYDEIYCYAGVVGRDMRRYGPFNSIGIHAWDIGELMGGDNSLSLGVVLGDPLELRVECVGTRGIAESYNLGSFTRTYNESQWDGHVIEELSGATAPERGDPGHTFNASFRLCHRTCDDAAFPPPILRQYDEDLFFHTVHYLGWDWTGERDDITGFKLYVNGHYRETIHNSHAHRLNLRSYMPDCGERNEYTLVAYQREGLTYRESPHSNPAYFEGEECPRQVKVSFEEFGVTSLRTFDSDMDGRGPIYGSFWANGIDMESLDFDGGECSWFPWFGCEGFQIHNGSYSIIDIFHSINTEAGSCIGDGCIDARAPGLDFLLIALDEGDDLTFGASIRDEKLMGIDERLFNQSRTISSEEPLPAEFTLEENNLYGQFTLRVHIEEID
ncbi:MAG: hypothetical protein GX577_05390 [Leptolinea sp.]|nr:hypothetical protein [Leptolinea sp.]